MFDDLVFSKTISGNRFRFFIFHVSLDSHPTRPTRWQHNRFAGFCKIFEELNENCRKFLVPDDYLSLDEALFNESANQFQIERCRISANYPVSGTFSNTRCPAGYRIVSAKTILGLHFRFFCHEHFEL